MSDAKSAVDLWNRDNRPGRAVTVERDDGSIFKTVTRTEAYVCASGEPVIFVEGIRGFYRLDRVRPYHGQPWLDVEYVRAGGLAKCEACGKTLYNHPQDLEHLGQHGIPFLHVLCDGSIVKL